MNVISESVVGEGLVSVSVVICAYTELRWFELLTLVEALGRQTVPPREVIVVVDHNPPLLAKAKAAFPTVVVAENSDAAGAAGARNLGCRLATGDVVGFIDDDAKPLPDWIEQVGIVCASESVLGVGGSIRPRWAEGSPSWFPEEFNWVVGCTYPGLPTKIAPVRNVIAANMAVRRDVFLAVGGFRAGFGNVKSRGRRSIIRVAPRSGDEETEFCIRVSRRWPERTWLYNPNMIVDHSVPAARGRLRYLVSRCYDEGLGKAMIARFAGRKRALASERPYVSRTLSRGVRRSLAEAALERDSWGVVRAGAILLGLGVTTLGFAVGSSASLLTSRESADTLAEVEEPTEGPLPRR